MKKTFFLLAFILPVCSLLAQTTPNPFPPGVADANRAYISSVGNDHVAKADQQGFDNLSIITQTNQGNKAIVEQINHNIDLDHNVLSIITQSGKNNKAFVTQEHKATNGGVVGNLEAYITQTGDDNKATQIQGPGSKTGKETLALINQSGKRNVAAQDQSGYYVTMTIDQSGNDNVAKQTSGNGLSRSIAAVNQTGNTNKAFQNQATGTSQSAYTTQTGNGNKSTQNQEGWVNLAVVDQSGKNNVARQDQTGKLNYATINQTSGGNVAKQEQTNTGFSAGHADGPGYPAANMAVILQEGGDGNVAKQKQTITDVQSWPYEANHGVIHQNGGGNKAFQTQDGGYNIGSVIQNGNNNVANVSQSQSIITP